VLVDKSLEVVVIAGPCDTDEVDFTGEFLCCCLDRGSFTIAAASSGRPEPEQGRLAGQRGSINFAATDQRCAELQRGRCDHDIVSGGRVGSCGLGGRRFGGRRFGDWRFGDWRFGDWRFGDWNVGDENLGCRLSRRCGAVIG
jgi:hypothetical protein